MSYINEMVSPCFIPTIPQGGEEKPRETQVPEAKEAVTDPASYYGPDVQYDCCSNSSANDEMRECSCGRCSHPGDCIDSICHPNGTAIHPDERID